MTDDDDTGELDSPRQPISTRRLEAFTDGVFSIAATLLVIDLTTTGFVDIHSDDDLWNALRGMQDTFISFTVSFALIALLWRVHVIQFELIKRVDHAMLVLNAVRLFFVVLIPFTTSLYGQFSGLALARVLFPLNFFLVAASGTAMWFYATSRRHRYVDLSDEHIRRTRVASLAATAVGAVVVLLSPFIGTFAFIAYAANGPIGAYFSRLSRGRRTHPAETKNSAGRNTPAGGVDGSDRLRPRE
jgi:uncharacterized membrane protein